MKDAKYRYEMLCIYDYRGVEAHLAAMAAKGWRLEKTGSRFWKYRRTEPAKVRYAVTYNAGASQFNPGPTEGQQSLEELCEAAGWAKVCDWFQMQIFSTEDPDALPLETDEALRLEVVHRSMRKSFLPANIILLVIGLLMSVSFLGTLLVNPLHIFERNSRFFTGTLFLLAAVLEVYTLFHYYGWRRRSRRSIERGGSCAPINTRAYQRLNRWGLALAGVVVVLYLLLEFFGGGKGIVLLYIVYIPLFFLVVFLIQRTTALLRKLKASKWLNILGTLIADVVLCAILIGGLAYGAVRSGWFSGSGGETYTCQNLTFDVHPREDVPLTLSDLTGESYQHTRRTWVSEGSFFLPEWSYREYALQNTEHEDVWPGSIHLSYTVWDPRLSWLRDALVQRYLDGSRPVGPTCGTVYQYLPEDPWGTEEAYRRYGDGEPLNDWLLVWPGRMAVLTMDWTPTPELKAVIAARLAPEA